VQNPAVQSWVPHWESVVQAFVQAPATPPAQTCELPQSLCEVHVDAVQPLERQSSLPQCESLVHRQRPRTQSPRVQSLSLTHVSATQAPVTAPLHVDPESEQLEAVVQVWGVHTPFTGGRQVAPNPQSVSALQAPLLVTSASADTWKSLNTTRPHWLAAAAATGVLNVMLRSMLFVAEPLDLPYIQRWLGGLMADLASWRGSLIVICPSVVEAPTLMSHCAYAAPLGNVVSTNPVMGSL
jgi:hypothetical protein